MFKRQVKKSQIKALTLSALVFGVASFLFFDQQISQAVSTDKHDGLYRPVRELTEFAEGKYYFAVIVLIFLATLFLIALNRLKPLKVDLLNKTRSLFEWSKFAFSSMLCGGLILQFVKHLIGRQRPHVSPDLNPHVFDIWTFNWHYHSFPSGHTQTVFTFATVLWLTFPKLNISFFIFPLILSLTRLPLEEHFTSDIVAGALLGFLATLWIAKKYHRIEIL